MEFFKGITSHSRISRRTSKGTETDGVGIGKRIQNLLENIINDLENEEKCEAYIKELSEVNVALIS